MIDSHRKMKKKINTSEIDLKRKLVEATDAVRKKFNTIKNKDVENKVNLEKIYEPITKPLKNISEAANHTLQSSINKSTSHVTEDNTNQAYENMSRHVAEELGTTMTDEPSITEGEPSYQMDTPPSSSSMMSGISPEKAPGYVLNHIESLRAGEFAYDTTYGIYIDNGKLMMGNAEVRFSDKNQISFWKRKRKIGTFTGNDQLYDLIFLKLPEDLGSKGRRITVKNKKIYGEILHITDVAYKSYNKRLGYNTSKSKKFTELIKPLSLQPERLSRSFKGSGLIPTKKLYTDKKVNYVYWNKATDLVECLRLLWGSKMAGNSNVDNEILSIMEELREEGIIY